MKPLRMLIPASLVLSTALVPAQATMHDWETFSGPGYRFLLPTGAYEIVESAPGRVVLEERQGQARIVAHAGSGNIASLNQLRETLEAAAPVAEITYSASGRSWFVLSGYTLDGAIWYTKVMLAGDRFSGFEITYPLADKRRMDAVVTRLEKGLRVHGG